MVHFCRHAKGTRHLVRIFVLLLRFYHSIIMKLNLTARIIFQRHVVYISGSSCECKPGWIGSTCDIPCLNGKYGSNCSSICSCFNGGKCRPTDGLCFCSPGFYGHDCSKCKFILFFKVG